VYATFVGVPPVTVIDVLVAVLSVFVTSVAIRVQVGPVSMAKALKVATPAVTPPSAALAVPERVHVEVIVTVSVWSSEATVPAAFSTATLKVDRFTPEIVVVGGSAVKATLVAVVAYTVIPLLTTLRVLVESVAVRVHTVPTEAVTVTAEKVSTPAVAFCAPPPATEHPAEVVVMAIESVAPAITMFEASSTETEKLGRVAPVVVPAGGAVVKTTWVAVSAPAGEAATMMAPAAISAEQAPTDKTLPRLERSDRPPPRFINFSMVSPLPYERFNYDIRQCLP
jgi:hypothetical protein